jgi:hypothetical protein
LASTSGELIRPPSASIDLRQCHRRRQPGQGLHCSHWMLIRKHYVKLGARRGRLPAQHLRRRNWTKRSGTLKPSINRFKRRERKCFRSLISKERLMRPPKKCVISPRRTKTEGPITESFIKKIHTMMMNGMVIFIMAILLSMMLLLWQQSCRLSHGPHHTSHLSFLCMMGTQTPSCF